MFASGQNSKLLYGDPPKSPRATRKFSSPPPLSIAKTSSPGRRRKLSLNIPIITGGKALDLAALSCNSNGYSSLYSAVSPFSKASLDTSKLYVSSGFANKIPDEGDTAAEKPEEPSALSKQSEWACGLPQGGRDLGVPARCWRRAESGQEEAGRQAGRDPQGVASSCVCLSAGGSRIPDLRQGPVRKGSPDPAPVPWGPQRAEEQDPTRRCVHLMCCAGEIFEGHREWAGDAVWRVREGFLEGPRCLDFDQEEGARSRQGNAVDRTKRGKASCAQEQPEPSTAGTLGVGAAQRPGAQAGSPLLLEPSGPFWKASVWVAGPVQLSAPSAVLVSTFVPVTFGNLT